MARDAAATLRRVFDNGRLLGQGFSRTHRLDLTLPDLTAMLPLLGAPCVAGGLRREPTTQASLSIRPPCAESRPAWCAYWRESLHGLVNGLSSSVWYSRVASPPGGSDTCVDLLHVDPWSPLRFQPVPEDLVPLLGEVAAMLRRLSPSAGVAFLGMAEGALHVRVDDPQRTDLGAVLTRTLARARPGLEVRDASSRSVLSPS